MQKYEEIKQFSEEQFRRLTGVKKSTFAVMVSLLLEAENNRYRRAGRKSSLTMEDRLLMALEYIREYRTYFHLGTSYGLSESACYRSCKWVEDVLIKSGKFALPGRKALLKSDVEYEVVLVDATESPIQRPKKK
ncbi:MAG: IS5 family transposase [Candidatus Amoebophilus sp. 36-38]|nr:MAG: IS5 family transposase [Candidatus Amoebophilus sp. 36-38]